MAKHNEKLKAVLAGEALGPDQIDAAKKGLVYFDPSNRQHMARMNLLFWNAVSETISEFSMLQPGWRAFEEKLRERFWSKAKQEFELWQSWADHWTGQLISRALDDGEGDFENDQTEEEDRDEIDYDPKKLSVPKV